MKTRFATAIVLSLALAATAPVTAQISLTGTSYTQDFDGMTSTGPNSSTPTGWFVGNVNGTNNPVSGTLVANGTGTDNTGTNYNFGFAGVNPVTDRALGSIASSTHHSRVTEVRFINNTGWTIINLNVSYDGEQWRDGGAGPGTNNTLTMHFSTDGTSFTAMGAAFTFTSPKDTATPGALDGNDAANRVPGIGGNFATNIANGTTFYLRWIDVDDPGADDGLAIDNFTLTVSLAIPGTNSWTDGTGKWETAGNWSLNRATVSGDMVLITNAGNNTVTIDATTAANPSVMTITNLTISANTLQLTNAVATTFDCRGGVALNGTLRITNSVMRIDSLAVRSGLILGTVSSLTGTVSVLADSQLIVTDTMVCFGCDKAARLVVGQNGRGVYSQSGGTVTVDQLVVTNGADSVFTLSGGALNSGGTFVTNAQEFVVGDGSSVATFGLLGGVHAFAGGLRIRTNATLTGCGTINGNVMVDAGGTVRATCGTTLNFTGSVTISNNADIVATGGTVLKFYGPVFNYGVIDATHGDVQFLSPTNDLNNGTVLTRNSYGSPIVNMTNAMILTSIGANGFGVALLGYPMQTLFSTNYFANLLDGAVLSDASTATDQVEKIQFYAASVDDSTNGGYSANVVGFRVLQSTSEPNQMTVYRSWVASIQTNNAVAPDFGTGSGSAGSFGVGGVAKDGTIAVRVDGTNAPASPMIGEGIFIFPAQVADTIIVTNGIENGLRVLALDPILGNLPQIGQNSNLVAKNSFANFSYVCRPDINAGNAGAAPFSSNGQIVVGATFNTRGALAHNDTAKMMATFVKTASDLDAGADSDAETGLVVMKYTDAGGPIVLTSLTTNIFGASSPSFITTNATHFFSRAPFAGPAQISINDSGAVAFAVSINVTNSNKGQAGATNGTRAAQVTGILYQPPNSTNFLLVTDNQNPSFFWIPPGNCANKNLISSVALDNYNNVYFMASYASNPNFPCDLYPSNALYQAVANDPINPTTWQLRILLKEGDVFTNQASGDVVRIIDLPYEASPAVRAITSRSFGPNAINRTQLPGHNSSNTGIGDPFAVGGLLVSATLSNLTQSSRTDGLLYLAPYSPSNINEWTNLGDGNWSSAVNWLLGVPSSTQRLVRIANGRSKIVTCQITNTTAITVSNLLVSGTTGSANVNTLAVTMSGSPTAARTFTVLNSLTIGSGGALTVDLQNTGPARQFSVSGMSGGDFTIDGSVTLSVGRLITTNVTTYVGKTGFGQMTVAGAGGLAQFLGRDLILGNVAGASGTVWIVGGTLTVTNGTTTVGNLGAGQMTVSGGTVAVSSLIVTNNINGSIINTNLLTLAFGGVESAATVINNGREFAVGDGSYTALYFLRGGVHSFADGLRVSTNASLGGNGTISTVVGATTGAVTFANGATWSPGTFGSAGTQTVVAAVVLNPGTILNWDCGSPGGAGDLVQITGNLTLDGTLNVRDLGGFTNGTYKLFTYGGTLTDNGLAIGETDNPSFTYTINTGAAGEVNLIVGCTNCAAPPDPFASWQSAYFTGGSSNPNAAPDADPLGKGISNTNQFLMGLDPTNSASTFAVIRLTRSGNDMVVTWKTSGGSSYSPGPKTNVLDYTVEGTNGSYSSNFESTGLTNIINTLGDVTTDATDAGGATNKPARYYRVRFLSP